MEKGVHEREAGDTLTIPQAVSSLATLSVGRRADEELEIQRM